MGISNFGDLNPKIYLHMYIYIYIFMATKYSKSSFLHSAISFLGSAMAGVTARETQRCRLIVAVFFFQIQLIKVIVWFHGYGHILFQKILHAFVLPWTNVSETSCLARSRYPHSFWVLTGDMDGSRASQFK